MHIRFLGLVMIASMTAVAGTACSGASTTLGGPSGSTDAGDGGASESDAASTSADGAAPQSDGGTLDAWTPPPHGIPDASAGSDASTAAPVITFVAPTQNAALSCRSMPTFDFSASVSFGAPFQSVRFDYVDVGDNGALAPAPAAHTFTTFANPFTETVDLTVLCAMPNAVPPRGGNWIFRVTATDADGHTVTAEQSFRLAQQ